MNFPLHEKDKLLEKWQKPYKCFLGAAFQRARIYSDSPRGMVMRTLFSQPGAGVNGQQL